MDRSQITKITLQIDGKKEVEIDPEKISALFFTEEAVKEILAPFYATGAGAGKGVEPLTKWTSPTDDGYLPAYLAKIPDCTLEIF